MKVSIIIPCKKIDSYCEQAIEKCLELDYDNFEILVLPNEKVDRKFGGKVRVIETGEVLPAVKRNIGMEKAKGEFFAFLDSDAFPEKDWLKKAMKYFENEKIGIAGGPNLTPPDGNFSEWVSGYVLSNFLVSGDASIRYKKAKKRYVVELPSCNYISRKEVSGKYPEGFLTAEDSKFCFDVLDKGYKILYAPDVVVYHHRRNSLKGHIKQVFVYARDIACLMKKEFSFDKLYYGLLSLCVLGFFALSIGSIFNVLVGIIFGILLLGYLFLIGITSIHKNIKTSFYVFLTSIATHFAYGIGWLYGLFSKK